MLGRNETFPKALLILNIKIGVVLRKVLTDSADRHSGKLSVSDVFLVVMLWLTCRNNPSSQQISFHSPGVADCPELNPQTECKTIITTPCHRRLIQILFPMPPRIESRTDARVPRFSPIFVKLTFCCEFFPWNSDFLLLRDPTGPESCSS